MSDRKVKGYCPACGNPPLFLDSEGVLHCDAVACADDGAAARLLDKPDQHVHLIMFRDDGYTVQHPLLERSAHGRTCALEPEFAGLREAPGIGLFLVPPGGTLADMRAVSEDEVTFEVPPPKPQPERVPVGTMTGWTEPVAPNGWVVLGEGDVPIPEDCPDLLRRIESGEMPWDHFLDDGRPALPSIGPETVIDDEGTTIAAVREMQPDYKVIMRVR